MSTVLPNLYRRWVNALLQDEIPPETLATCNSCAMVTADPNPKNGTSFHPDVKCCTYLPVLHNFLVGAILNDEFPESQQGCGTVQARIRRRVAVSPLGLHSDPSYLLLYSAGMHGGSFGRSVALRCPHLLQDGQCGIWQHRNAICSTWFCKYRRGAVGMAFWESLREMLVTIEHGLALWCVLQLGLATDSLKCLLSLKTGQETASRPMTPFDLDGEQDDAKYRAVWGQWHGREQDFYSRSAQLVAALNWDEVLAVAGVEAAARAQVVLAKYAELVSPAIPKHLVPGNCQLTQITPHSADVVAYSAFHPARMNRSLYDALPYFDGSDVEEVRERIHKEKHVRVRQDVLRMLVDQRILVNSDDCKDGDT